MRIIANMNKKYSVPLKARPNKILQKFACIIIFINIILLISGYQVENVNYQTNKIIIIPLTLLIFILIITDNVITTIWIDSEGLFIEFSLIKLRIYWNDITGIYYSHAIPLNDVWLITCKRGLTPFHYFYSFFLFSKTIPGFYLLKKSKATKEILQIIQENTNLRITEI
jgi:hypothetical protein